MVEEEKEVEEELRRWRREESIEKAMKEKVWEIVKEVVVKTRKMEESLIEWCEWEDDGF